MLFFTMNVDDVIQAQEENNMSARLEKIEKITSKLPQISGTANLRYRYDDATATNGMDIRRARVNLKGNLSPKVDYRMQVDFANSPMLLDVHIGWQINPFINVRAGQFHTMSSIENPYGPKNLEAIDYSLVVSNLSGYSDVSGVSSSGRDIGVQLTGGFIQREGYNLIDYTVGLFNGNGINLTDDNKSKDFSGILSVHPIQPLTIAVFHYNGSAGAQGANHQRVRTGAGVLYDDSKLVFRGEYIQGVSTDPANGASLDSEGFYALLGYCFAQKVQPIVKYDYWHRDKADRNSLIQAYLVGVNYFPINHLKLQVNYTYRQNIGAKDSNQVGVQLCGFF
ncbi:MAG: OprO/OprP family phosphate-selective porin [Bacteroidales bacterium]|nr:OprO/OprP family phosphate-selective porin [Bacteroidales bacterium]